MKKRGSLSLSVNAIVILILAITMLGLGLGFIKGMFGNVSSQIEEQVAQEPEPPTATGGNPITISRESMITQAGASEVIKVQVYNPTNTLYSGAQPTIDCGTDGNSELGIAFSGSENPQTNSKNVPVGQRESFNLLLDVSDNAEAKTYLCKISDLKKADGDTSTTPVFTAEKDLTITVRQ